MAKRSPYCKECRCNPHDVHSNFNRSIGIFGRMCWLTGLKKVTVKENEWKSMSVKARLMCRR